MKVIIVEPQKAPYTKEIEDSLRARQEIVGGFIEVHKLFSDDDVVVICNEDGKLQNLPMNRVLRDDDGHIYDVLVGTFIVIRLNLDKGEFVSLTEKQEKKYLEYYQKPEYFRIVDGKILVSH